ncbi:DUF6796 family protein [Enterococcus sp. LJL90]
MNLEVSLGLGLLASLIMFSGDMLFYFVTTPYKSDGSLNPVIDIMTKIPEWRLKLGSILGPVAAFIYCFGFYHLFLIVESVNGNLMFIIYATYCLGIIIGGAYHSHFIYLGLIRKQDASFQMKKIVSTITLMGSISVIFIGISYLGLFLLFMFDKTIYPRFFSLISPGILYLLKPLWKYLPQPFLVIFYGGWGNLISTIYYATLLIYG